MTRKYEGLQNDVEEHWTATPIAMWASEVVVKDIPWILPGYLAEGLITLLQGPIGARKTTLLLGWAAAMTQGHGYHLGTVEHRKRGVLFVTNESGVDYANIVRYLGGDHELFRCFGAINMQNGTKRYTRAVNLWDDQEMLFEQCAQFDDLGAIMVDPIATHLGNKNDSTQIQKCCSVLEQLMERFDCCCAESSHLNKDPFKSADMRTSGAIEITSRARCFFTVAKDREDKTISRVVPVRTSFTDEDSLGFSYRNSPDGHGAIWIEGKYGGSADDILRKDDPGEKNIREWLLEYLPLGTTILVSRIRNDAEHAGFDWKSVDRAKVRLSSIKSIEQDADVKGKIRKCWFWTRV